MNQSLRWKRFISWWVEFKKTYRKEDFAYVRLSWMMNQIDAKIEELKGGKKGEK